MHGWVMFAGNLFCRTDSALKFGLFFLLYLVNITSFLLKCPRVMIFIYIIIVFINAWTSCACSSTFFSAYFLLWLLLLYLRENHWRKFLACLFLKAFGFCELALDQICFLLWCMGDTICRSCTFQCVCKVTLMLKLV